MLKYLLSISLLCSFTFSLYAQSGFSINGKAAGAYEGAKVILSYHDLGQEIRDSATVTKGSFLLKGKVTTASVAALTLTDQKKESDLTETFFLENVALSADVNKDAMVIKGPGTQSDYAILKSCFAALEDKMKAAEDLSPKAKAIRKEMYALKDKFILEHPDSYVTVELVNDKFRILNFPRQSTGYTLTIQMKNAENLTPVIKYSYPDDRSVADTITDTSFVTKNGMMIFKGKVSEPVFATLEFLQNPATLIQTSVGPISAPPLQFFLVNEEITITGDGTKPYLASISGGQLNKEWAEFKQQLDPLADQIWAAKKNAYTQENLDYNSEVSREISKMSNDYYLTEEKLRLKFIETHPSSLLSMYLLSRMKYLLSHENLKLTYDKLDAACKSSSYARSIMSTIESTEKTAIGSPALPIKKRDINGNIISLEDFKGKYVLLDFWASWCTPCRKSHPQLKALYAKYKAEGFEILGIAQEVRKSAAETRDIWKKAIEEDDIDWLQILNNEDIGKSNIVKDYGVTSFPTKFLLDREGKIIGRYHGNTDALEMKLKEIFGK